MVLGVFEVGVGVIRENPGRPDHPEQAQVGTSRSRHRRPLIGRRAPEELLLKSWRPSEKKRKRPTKS